MLPLDTVTVTFGPRFEGEGSEDEDSMAPDGESAANETVSAGKETEAEDAWEESASAEERVSAVTAEERVSAGIDCIDSTGTIDDSAVCIDGDESDTCCPFPDLGSNAPSKGLLCDVLDTIGTDCDTDLDTTDMKTSPGRFPGDR